MNRFLCRPSLGGSFRGGFVGGNGPAAEAIADLAGQINGVARRKARDIDRAQKLSELVPPRELLGPAGQEEEEGHAALLHLDQSLPDEPDLVLPEPAVV